MTGWAGRGIAYYYASPCVTQSGQNTGSCNTTNHKANYGIVDFNDYYTVNRHFLVRHETGHLFGLLHTDCSYYSVMQGSPCPSAPVTLTNHDKADINAVY